jgi:signal peptide peptidase SppA
VIGVGDLTSWEIRKLLLDSREDFLRGDRVKAILLHMDTPGGASTDSDDIYVALMQYKTKYNVPIYVYVDGMCASGGMYIACAADKIFASPSSVIGSVGVRMGPIFNVSETMTKVGVSSLTLTEGKDKDALNPFRPWRPNEDADIRDVMASLYDRFVSIVTTARPTITQEKLVNDYGAHIFIAKKAEELGYIDMADTTYGKALSELTQAAQLGQAKYQVVQLVPQRNIFNALTQSMSPHKILQWMGLSPPVHHPDLSGKMLYLYP